MIIAVPALLETQEYKNDFFLLVSLLKKLTENYTLQILYKEKNLFIFVQRK